MKNLFGVLSGLFLAGALVLYSCSANDIVDSLTDDVCIDETFCSTTVERCTPLNGDDVYWKYDGNEYTSETAVKAAISSKTGSTCS